MSDDLRLKFEIVGQDSASSTLREVTTALETLNRQARKTGEGLRKAFGADFLKPMTAARAEAKGFGEDLAAAADKAAKALRGDVAAVAELRTALRGAVTEQRAFGEAVKASQAAGAAAARSQTTAARNAATGRARAAADDLRGVRQRWKVREASERAERREVERTEQAWAVGQRRRLSIMDKSAAVETRRHREQSRTESIAADRRINDVGRVWQIRQRSEAAELKHLRTASRERDAMRRHAMTAGRHAYGHARHAVRSVNHPALASAGHAAALGAAFGAGAAKIILERSVDIDSAAARYRMFAVPEGVDAGKATAEAVRAAKLDSVKLGMDASTLLDIQAKAVRDGISPAIAKTLPESIAAAAKVMGGDPERLTDTLSEGIQQGLSMGLMKDAGDVRRFLNLEAGLSNYAGNSSVKMEQFVAAGGIGRGKELGLNLTDTMAYGALLNSSGMRTGQATSRFLGQLSQSVPKMGDKYRQAVDSHKNTEEDRAVRSAPRALGYGGIREMQSQILAGPEGMIEFAVRLNKLNEKQRKLILEGYGFSEQGGGALAEIGASPEKAKGVLKRAKELASQAQANDYLSQKFADWQTSLANMLQQIEAGWRAIESEVGDVLKNDIVSPIRDWWVTVSAAILNSGMKDEAHHAIVAFINGLRFADMRTALDAMSGNMHGVDVAGFAKGVGEGLRAVYDNLARLAGLFGHGGNGLDAEQVGKFAAELFGLSVSLHIAAPAITLLGGIASGVLAIKAAVEGVAIVARLTGIADGLRAIVGLETAATAAGLLSIAGGLTAIGAAVQALLSAGVLNRIEVPHDLSKESWDHFLWGRKPDGSSARPGWVDGITGGGSKPGDGLVRGPHGGLMPAPQGFHPTAYQGGEHPNNWRNLLQRASYEPSDSEDIVRDATVDTARGVVAVKESVDRLAIIMRTATLPGSGSASVAGFGGGGGEGGGNANLRYGHGAAGGYRSTPGTGSYGNPSKSLLDLIAKSEGAGYNVSWGNGRFLPGGKEQNLTGKSLNEILSLGDTMRRQPGARNSSALGRYQITGSTLRDLMKRMGLNGSEKFDEKMQDRLASKLISDEGPRALGRWEGLKRGSYMAQAQGLLRSGSIAAQPGDTSFNGGGGGNAGAAVDKALSMQGMGEGEAARTLKHYMHSGEWCADFVNGALSSAGVKGTNSAMARSFSTWGHHVGFGDAKKGDVITERHGDHVGHVGMATGNVQRDRNGNVTAVEMVSGNYGHMVKRNWEKVGMIADLRRSDQAIAETARKVGATVAPAMKAPAASDIAKHVPTHARPRPGAGDAAGGSMTSADNSTTSHTWHVYGEPARQAVQEHLANRDSRNSRTTDLDAFA